MFSICTGNDGEVVEDQWSIQGLDDNEESKKKQRKRKDTGMHKRKDQVIRDLLRKIRREYKKAFYGTIVRLIEERSLNNKID